MRPTSRRYPTVYSLALIVLMAYCVWQKQELDHLKGTAASEYVNVNEAKDSLRQLLGVENLPTPSATHSTKVSYVTSFWATRMVALSNLPPNIPSLLLFDHGFYTMLL